MRPIDPHRYAIPGTPRLLRVAIAPCLAALVLGAGGCAFLHGSAVGSAFVVPGNRHLRLPRAAGQPARSVAYRSPYQYQEYDRSRGRGRAEALFFLALGKNKAFELSPKRLRYLTTRWRFNRAPARLNWGPAHRLRGTGTVYRRYRRDASSASRRCVAFMRAWKRSSLDPLNRPRRAYIGYYCRPPGAALGAAAARNYLRGIRIRSPTQPTFHIGQRVPRDQRALTRATGAADSGWGMAGFPLKRVRQFPLGASYNSSG